MKNNNSPKDVLRKVVHAIDARLTRKQDIRFERDYRKFRLADEILEIIRMETDLFFRRRFHRDEPRKNLMLTAVCNAILKVRSKKKEYFTISSKGQVHSQGEASIDAYLAILLEFHTVIAHSAEADIDETAASFGKAISLRFDKAASDMQTITDPEFQQDFKSTMAAAVMFEKLLETLNSMNLKSKRN